ncbi:hypothetical protein B0H21DRAFT_813518 [Amylocystis lapponica]|nr:hypothetical protein B0H21DRAFT_813518 [Amylocystis lapponica]
MALPPVAVALNINELIVVIFSYLDERSLARAASVSKLWAEIALDCLWRNVDDLLPLFSILCPFARPEKFTIRPQLSYVRYKFSRCLSLNDWANFQRYARRVSKIQYDGYAVKSRRRLLDKSVFEEIARTCPTAEIFPNLHTLCWHSSGAEMQSVSVVFMHPRIKVLEVRIHQSDDYPLYVFVDAVKNRMPYTTYLNLQFSFPVREIEDHLSSLLRGLRRLQRYVMPLYSLTSKITEALGTLDDLRVIEFGEPLDSGNGDRADIENFCPVIPPGAFPAVQRSCLSAQLPNVTRTLQAEGLLLPRLTNLRVHVIAIVSPLEVENFFQTIRDKFHWMTELYVDFTITPDSVLTVPAPPLDERPDIVTFRPLLACRQLRKFDFRWEYPLNLTDADMEEFASSLPLLEHLFLNCEPVVELEPPPLTIAALLPFAQHCPRLRLLGLYFHAAVQPSHCVPTSASFAELTELRVGVSSITRVEPVVLFLSQLCKLGCTLIPGLRWPDAYGIALDRAGILDERRSRMTEHWVLWTEVAKVLPMVTKARLEERTVTATIQQQLARLTLSSREEKERGDRLEREVMDLRFRSR